MENYNWETSFDAISNSMVITFSDRVKAEFYRTNGVLAIFKDGTILYHYNLGEEGEPLAEIGGFTTILLDLAKEANRLSQFSKC